MVVSAQEHTAQQECGSMSPFTQFLTEMNSRINKHALGTTLAIEEQENEDCCWLTKQEENPITSR